MLTILQYIKERFPIPSALLFALGYAALALGLSHISAVQTNNLQDSLVKVGLLTSVFFFFLLRQRVIDEFRDASHDLRYFPNRPIPRGLVSKKQISFLGFIALVIEVSSAFFVGKSVLIFYLFFFVYSLLMAKEFFVPKWLDKHFTTYFLIHEVVFALLGLFFISALSPNFIGTNLRTLLSLIALTVAPMSIEVIRKFKPRYDKSGKAVADTYSTVWGRDKALFLVIFLSIVVGLSLFLLKSSHWFLVFNLITTAGFLTLGKKSDSGVIFIGALSFLGFAFLANIL